MHPLHSTRSSRHTQASSQCSQVKVKLGILLSEAGLLSPVNLQSSIEHAARSGKPIGRVLVETNRITEFDLENALLAQSMIQEGLLERKDACEALKYAKDNNLPFAQVTKWIALDQTSITRHEAIIIDLLLKSKLVSERTIEEAQRISIEREITIANALLKMRAVSFTILNVVVECLQLVNDQRISKTQALSLMKTMNEDCCDLATAFEKSGLQAKNTLSKIKIGDILLSARVVNEADLLNSLEKSISDNRLLGELLIEAGILSKDLLDEALFLQKMCKIDLITRQTAARVLRRAHETKRTVQQVSHEMGIFRDEKDIFESALDLLFNANLASEKSVYESVKKFTDYGMDPLNALVANDKVKSRVLKAAIELARLLEREKLSKEKAIKVLYLCDISNCSPEEAFKELNVITYDKLDALDQKAIKDGVSTKLAMPVLHKSKEFIALAIVFGVAALALIVFKASLSQLLLVLAGLFVLCLSVVCACFLVRYRKVQLQACQQEIKEKEEAAMQEVSRLRRLK